MILAMAKNTKRILRVKYHFVHYFIMLTRKKKLSGNLFDAHPKKHLCTQIHQYPSTHRRLDLRIHLNLTADVTIFTVIIV